MQQNVIMAIEDYDFFSSCCNARAVMLVLLMGHGANKNMAQLVANLMVHKPNMPEERLRVPFLFGTIWLACHHKNGATGRQA